MISYLNQQKWKASTNVSSDLYTLQFKNIYYYYYWKNIVPSLLAVRLSRWSVSLLPETQKQIFSWYFSILFGSYSLSAVCVKHLSAVFSLSLSLPEVDDVHYGRAWVKGHTLLVKYYSVTGQSGKDRCLLQ